MPYEVRDKAWEAFAKQQDMPDNPGFDYTRNAVETAYKAGWRDRKTAEYEAIVNIGRDD